MIMSDQESADWLSKSPAFQQRVQWATTYNIAVLQAAAPPSDPDLARENERFVAFVKRQGYFASAAKVAADTRVLAGATRNWPIRNVAWAEEAAIRDHGYIADKVLLDAAMAVMRADFEQAEDARKHAEIAAAEGE
jgi:hypothetical protein